MITWAPISEMPDKLRGGRDVRVQFRNGTPLVSVIARCIGNGKWESENGIIWDDADLSHYSEINEPEGVR